MLHRGEIVTLNIEGYAFGGKGIAKIPMDGSHFVVFVDNAFPGQVVSAKISTKRKNHAEAKLVEVIKRAPCEKISEFQEISGAPYLFVPEELQRAMKSESTLSTFSKISGQKNMERLFDEYIASPSSYFYRNKMEYSFSSIEHIAETGEELDNAFALGFKRRGTWWKVENLNRPSGLFDQEWESQLPILRTFLQDSQLPAWHPPQKKGFFRHIIVRKSFKDDRLLVHLVTSSKGIKSFNAPSFVAKLLELHGERIAGVQHTVNDEVADRSKIENGRTMQLFGSPWVEEILLGLTFQMRMESFFQTNPKCAELLYQKAIDYLLEDLNDGEEILDLFCGTGTIAQLIAQRKKEEKISGVDLVAEAIEDAKENALKNGLSNVSFYASDVGKFLKEHPHLEGKIAAVVLDPPRAGIAPKTLLKTIGLGARRIVYISCNPSTQARDASILFEAGYSLEKFSLVDQFPHTGHIESIAKFIKK
ncbi:MAG: 23S rRNA (uracil(1939)-C(5))-methyltransferase RlmD [Bacteroidetes bacterium]|nr:23S rRNA (uracil(1939)-C(5))-methyltransferase RlmD [Bacteroidota bacterium]MBM3424833.1 23S rRNA (uracil(1939)-C(5))-methyltransferase RlmD [Bacteroidota bacterium]